MGIRDRSMTVDFYRGADEFFVGLKSLQFRYAAHLMRALAVIFAMFLLVAAQAAAQEATTTIKVDRNFDHSATAFPLDGAHGAVSCETCHAGAVFKGVPTACEKCHNGDMASGKTETHPETAATCSNCHTSSDWKTVHVDHGPIVEGCFSCHNNDVAAGKGKNHIETALACEDCHVTSSWTVDMFDHDKTDLTCETCHDRTHASGKPFDHLRSGNDCATCHVNMAWNIGTFDHTGIVSGCFTCHDGIGATGKQQQHLPTSDTCESCHTPVAWTVVSFTHDEIVPPGTSCDTCHDGQRATGKDPGTHFRASSDCAACHVNKVWTPATFDHDFISEPSGSAVSNCVSCHNGARAPADGKNPGHIQSSSVCEDCHSPTNFASWTGAAFSHDGVTSGCQNCHIVDKPGTHLKTTDTCESCHQPGVMWAPFTTFDHTQITGTCFDCHTGGMSTSKGTITGKTNNHPSTNDDCENCHTGFTAWTGAKFDHTKIVGSPTCASCHDNAGVAGRDIIKTTHLAVNSGSDCVDCHVTRTFTAVSFDHAAVSPTCFNCHNGSTSTPGNGTLTTKSSKHVPVGNPPNCENCHKTTTTWYAAFDHSGITQGCASCHADANAAGLDIDLTKHIPFNVGTDCSACHTPTTFTNVTFKHEFVSSTCISCHDGSPIYVAMNALGKSAASNHPSTSDDCALCHTGFTAWTGATFDHELIVGTPTCYSCHNGTDAKGKSKLHILSQNTCDNCHQSTSWSPAVTDHGVVIGTCYSCHDGSHKAGTTTIETKSGQHVNTTSNCAACHVTANWTVGPGRFDHAQSLGTCMSCHDGVKATGKTPSPPHPVTSSDCGLCHNTAQPYWSAAAKPDHSSFIANCVSCHTGPPNAKGKIAGHFPSTNNCDICHTTTAFKPANFDHAETSVTTCNTCHDGQQPPAPGKSITHMNTSTNCENCHSSFSTWANANFDHGETTATCVSCHDGSQPPALGKSPTHFKTTTDCAACHLDSVWTLASGTKFDHNQATGTCVSCHDGTRSIAAGPVLGKNAAPAHPTSSNTCDDCHKSYSTFAGAAFSHDGIVSGCFSCHNGTKATGKNTTTHLTTTNVCEDCHVPTLWTNVAFDHAAATGTCVSCHDGSASHVAAGAIGKSLTHLKTTNVCEDCHTSSPNWQTTNFDHAAAVGTCLSCHDGAAPHTAVGAVGKSGTHLKTTNICEDCHVTTAWNTVNFDHTAATGTCLSCHDGSPAHTAVNALGKSGQHFATSNTCDACHTSVAWSPNTAFDHSQATGTCLSCHNGTRPPAVGKSNTHFVTSQACENCHTSTTNWALVGAYTHVTPFYEPHRATVTCLSCHTGTPPNEKIAYKFAGGPDCAGCHTNRYKPDPHTKFGNAKYTALELKDCSGACHIYTDITLSVIKTRRNGAQHRGTGSF